MTEEQKAIAETILATLERQKAIAEMILSTLERQKFTDFYNTGDFDRYIRGEEDAKSRDEILEEIVKLFRIS